MRKDILLESINRQRKLMGLNELLDANIDAKGALSGNKLDLGIVPLEEMDPDDDLPASYRMYNSDDWVNAQKDEIGRSDDELADDPDAQEMADSDEIDLSDVDSSDDVNRHPDEDDFYRQQPGEDLSDTMDSRYPDPNERDWQMNRYSGLDEGFFDSIKAGAGAIGSMPTVFKYKKSKLGWDKEMKNIKKYLDGIKNTLNSANASLAKANQVFPQIKQLGSSIAGFNIVEKEHNDINKMIQTLNTSINSAEQTLDADEKADEKADDSTINSMLQNVVGNAKNNPNSAGSLTQQLKQLDSVFGQNPKTHASILKQEQILQDILNHLKNPTSGGQNTGNNSNNNNNDNKAPTQADGSPKSSPDATAPVAPVAPAPVPDATAPAPVPDATAPVAPVAPVPAAGQKTNNGFAPPIDTNKITNKPNEYYDEGEPYTGQNKGNTNISEKKKKK